jgi:D-aminopeptidase
MFAHIRGPILIVVALLLGAPADGRQTAPSTGGAGADSGSRVRARDLGITIGTFAPGPLNAITDVAGVLVGHTTIVRGEGPLRVGEGPVRTGVTAVLPRRDVWFQGVYAATHTLNGDGEMTGIHWIRDMETLVHPILITNTGSVGAVHDAAVRYMTERHPKRSWATLPVVAETWDGTLSDVRGRHVQYEHVAAAIDSAAGGPVAEGNVGGGTGMVCFRFKCGIGTSSRVLEAGQGGFTIGVLVQANYGGRDQLRVDGVPVGRDIPDLMPGVVEEAGGFPREGSIIVVVGTDAPLSSRQLERVARRAALGIARTGGTSGNTSGDIILAFSTANVMPLNDPPREFTQRILATDYVEPIFRAVVDAAEEAILNALLKGATMRGADDRVVHELPYDRLAAIMRQHGREIRVPGRQ